jgi:hypothetical protein
LDALALAGLFSPMRTEKGFCSMFGVPSVVVDVLLGLILRLDLPCSKFSSPSLFMTLNFLKDPASSAFNFGSRWRVDGQTFMERTLRKTLTLIDFVLPEVFSFFLSLFSYLFNYLCSSIWKIENKGGSGRSLLGSLILLFVRSVNLKKKVGSFVVEQIIFLSSMRL